MSGEQRREEIVTVAQEVIASKGFEGLRVRDVADRVGINIATLHYHFPSKEALVTAVMRHIIDRLDRAPRPAPADSPTSGTPLDPKAVLTAHIAHILTLFRTDRQQFVVLNELYARAVRDTEVRELLQASDTAWADFLIPVLQAGRDTGQFRADLDPQAAAVLITGFFKSLLFHLDLSADQARHAADELLRAIKTEEPNP